MSIVESGQDGHHGQHMIPMASIIHRNVPTDLRYNTVK